MSISIRIIRIVKMELLHRMQQLCFYISVYSIKSPHKLYLQIYMTISKVHIIPKNKISPIY